MKFLKAFFKPSKKSFMHQYVGTLAHLNPFGQIEKDFSKLTVTLVSDKGQSSVDLIPLYTEWVECEPEARERYILGKVSDQMAGVSGS